MRERKASAVAIALPVAVSFLLFLGLALRAGSIDGFRFNTPVGVGSLIGDPSLLLPGQVKSPGAGFDGQFFFYIAQDPFLRNPATSRSLDNSIRYRRILYPLLAWALSLGQRAWLPYVLILIDVAACTAAVAGAAVAAARAGRTPWLALVAAIAPGLWVSLLHDMAEPLQVALAVWALVLESPLLLFLSAMTKETSATVLATEAGRHLVARRWRPAAYHLAGLVALGAWTLGVLAFVSANQRTLAPADFASLSWGPAEALRESAAPLALAAFLVPAALICILGLARLAWIRDRYALGAAAFGLVALLAGATTWMDPFAQFRNSGLAGILVFLSWLSARDRLGFAVVVLMLFTGVLALAAVLVPI